MVVPMAHFSFCNCNINTNNLFFQKISSLVLRPKTYFQTKNAEIMIENILHIPSTILINPNFIYNRFDLTESNYILLHISKNDRDYYLEVSLKDNYAELGAWLMHISKNDFDEISAYIFNNYIHIKYISFYNVITDLNIKINNFFYLNLPLTYSEIEHRLTTKSRQRLRRNKRDAAEKFGEMNFMEYSNAIPDAIVNEFFKLKRDTLHIEYNLSCQDYIKKYHVTNAYTLSFGKRIAAIFFTCEQCPIVYGENFSYDGTFAYYSPGILIYDLIIQRLIEKGKTQFFLGGGNYEYKKKYKSTEISVCEGRIYRNSLIKFKYACWDFYNNHFFWKLKKTKTFLHF